MLSSVTASERLVSLADLYALRRVNPAWVNHALHIYQSYCSFYQLNREPKAASPIQQLRQQLDEGWVGALLFEGKKQRLAGATLGRVERYLDAVSVYVITDSVRMSRRNDQESQDRRFACLRHAMLQQTVWYHLCFGEESSSTATPRIRHTIFTQHEMGAVTERYVWDTSTGQLQKQ